MGHYSVALQAFGRFAVGAQDSKITVLFFLMNNIVTDMLLYTGQKPPLSLLSVFIQMEFNVSGSIYFWIKCTFETYLYSVSGYSLVNYYIVQPVV